MRAVLPVQQSADLQVVQPGEEVLLGQPQDAGQHPLLQAALIRGGAGSALDDPEVLPFLVRFQATPCQQVVVPGILLADRLLQFVEAAIPVCALHIFESEENHRIGTLVAGVRLTLLPDDQVSE